MKRSVQAYILIALILLVLVPTMAEAQSGFGMVEIIVTDETGARLSNADLCLAMPGQHARKMTDSNGAYKTTLPVGPATIRVFRSGYANAQDTVNMTNGANLVKQITLQQGQSTPLPSDCGSIAATTTPGNSCDVITAVQATGGQTTTDRRVPIRIEIKERPYAYRIAEFPQAETIKDNFDPDDAFRKHNVLWQPVVGPAAGALTTFFNLTEPGYGTHSIYVQTQRYQSGCVSRSRVLSVVLAPASYQTYTFKGIALQQFITDAKARGYEFHNRFHVLEDTTSAKRRCTPGTFMQLPDYNTARRRNNELWQDLSAELEVFNGPALLPFWSIQSLKAEHPSLPPTVGYNHSDPNRSEMAVVYEMYATLGCPQQGCQDKPARVFRWKRKTYSTIILSGTPAEGGVTCERIGAQDAHLTELVVRGPASDNPINALGDLRVLRPLDFRLAPPPRTILPRGVEEKEGTAVGDPPAEPTAPDARP